MSKRLIVAIDGPAGSGKSTSAKLVAEKLGYLYVDTGAMYRAVTFLAMQENILDDKDAVTELANSIDLDMEFFEGNTKVMVNDLDLTDEIRSREVNSKVSSISKIEGVRKALVKKQRQFAQKENGIVIEGRDIGTVVFPEADVKIFLTASISERAKRRAKEYEDQGVKVSLNEIKKNLEQRDASDSTREISPLIKAPDAIEVDTSKVSVDDQVNIILEQVRLAADKKDVEVSK
jgi:cytidylate kinase